ncbi:hypothetical protein [Carboxylicivirga linearis]|uniref:Uncharacterized protein n=1 Tax=Carboxylicivirga linearis TaxID=1628157 RepID=A0ABS5K026_9BACT|nr:hypothetical protein [Carboxylicivirga linearis]MBS2100021.1 hypothetical protein [Carboxylicivirga linearis]
MTVRFKTGFLYEEITNAKIIGQYASLLCNELKYEGPVLLDFIHDYGQSYMGKNYSFVNFGSDNYSSVNYYRTAYDSLIEENVLQMVSYSNLNEQDLRGLEKMVFTTEPVDSIEKIVIRQFGFHFDVNKTLNLLHYAINNPNETINLSQKDSLASYLPNMYYELNTIPKCKIDSISSLKIKDVEKIIGQKIYAKVDTINNNRISYSYFAQNNCYLIYASVNNNEIVLDTLNQIYSFELNNDYWQSLFVFETPKSFKYYEQDGFDNEFKKSRLHEMPINEHESIVFFDINWISEDIYFINLLNSFEMSAFKIFPYLKRDDILITDFENYIESYRKD